MTGRTERDTIGEQEFLRRQHAARQLFNYATSYFADVASIFRFFFLSLFLSPSFPLATVNVSADRTVQLSVISSNGRLA